MSFPAIDAAAAQIAHMSYNAVRVPPIQFQTFVGSAPHMVTSDILTGCGPPHMPAFLAQIMKMLQDGTAYIESIANSISNQIAAGISQMTGQLNSMMAQATAGLQSGLGQVNAMIAQATGAEAIALNSFVNTMNSTYASVIGHQQSMLNTMGGSTINGVTGAVSNIVGQMPSMANLISQTNAMSASVGMAGAGHSISSVFAPIVGGQMNALLSPVMGTVANMQMAVSGTMTQAMSSMSSAIGRVTGAVSGAIGAAVATATSAMNAAVSTMGAAVAAVTAPFNSAVASVMDSANAIIGGITGAISSALGNLTHMANAAAMAVMCKAASEFNSFIDSVASPALKAALPAPI